MIEQPMVDARFDLYENMFTEASSLEELRRIIIEQLPPNIKDSSIKERLLKIVVEKYVRAVMKIQNQSVDVSNFSEHIDFSNNLMRVLSPSEMRQRWQAERQAELNRLQELLESVIYQLGKHFAAAEPKQDMRLPFAEEEAIQLIKHAREQLVNQQVRRGELKSAARRGVDAAYFELDKILSSETVDNADKNECIRVIVDAFTNRVEISLKALERDTAKPTQENLDSVDLEIDNVYTMMSRMIDHEYCRRDPELSETIQSLRDVLVEGFRKRYNKLRLQIQ